MTGWNLPPGCNVSDIPGNRPQDELADMIADGWRPRCSSCGAYMKISAPIREREAVTTSGARYGVAYTVCAKCGVECVEDSWPLDEPDWDDTQ